MGGIYYKGCNLLQKFDRHLRIQLDLIYSIQFKKFKIIPPHNNFWSPQVDSNHRPADYKSAALPTELCGLTMQYIVEFTGKNSDS